MVKQTVYVLKINGSVYGVFSSGELARQYADTRNMGGIILSYEMDYLVPKGPFKYWDAYLNLDGSVYRTSETTYKSPVGNENAIMTHMHGTEMSWGQSSTSLDEALRLAKDKLSKDKLDYVKCSCDPEYSHHCPICGGTNLVRNPARIS